MAPRRTSTEDSKDAAPPALQEIIFSCSICYALPSDVYATKESNHGFHSNGGGGDGVVTKFWISDCSHVFCGRHLENEAPPFHPHGHRPRAPCPVCVARDPRSTEPRELFGIRGLQPGHYDPGVPEEYFKCPPMRLNTNANDPDLDALKFQYSHISSYAVQATKLWRADRRRRDKAEKALTKERQQWENTKTDMSAQIAELKKGEARLRKWEQRKAMINHYLGMVGSMAEDLKKMRSHLVQLGFDVPEQSYSFDPDKHDPERREQPKSATADRLQSSNTLVGDKHGPSSSSLKRKSDRDHYAEAQEGHTQHVNDEAMMPPPLPPQRQQPRQAPTQAESSEQHHPSQQSHNVPPAPLPYAYARPAPSQLPPIQPYDAARPSQPAPPRIDTRGRNVPQSDLGAQMYGGQGTWHASQSNDPVAQQNVSSTNRQPVYRNSQQPRQLPFRPPQFADQQRSRNTADAESADTRSGTYLSQPARRRSGQHHYTDMPDTAYIEPHSAQIHPQLSAHSAPHANPAYRTRAQDTAGYVSGYMESPDPLLSQPNLNQVPQRRSIVTPVQRRPLMPPQPAESVVSPFFKASQRSDTTQRPPARGIDMRQPYAPSERGSSAMPPPRAPVSSSHYTSAGNHASRGMPPPGAQSFRHTDHLTSMRESSIDPLSQAGNFRQPAYGSNPSQRPSPTAQQYGVAPPSSAYRNRMTLPPSSSRLGYSNSQDPELSRIQGVREGGYPPANIGRASVVPAYGVARNLYVAAGSRRSVLR